MFTFDDRTPKQNLGGGEQFKTYQFATDVSPIAKPKENHFRIKSKSVSRNMLSKARSLSKQKS